MQNDFLSSLSLRAIQETQEQPAVGGLSPRLASLFEPTAAARLSMPDSPSLEAGNLLEVETPQAAGTRPAEVMPRQNAVEMQPKPGILERLRVERHSEAAPASSAPDTNPTLPSAMPQREKENSPQPALTSPFAPPPTQDHTPEMRMLQSREAATQNPRPDRQAETPIKTISEQIIITRQELQPPQKGALQALTDALGRQKDTPTTPAPAALPGKRSSAKINPEQIIITRREVQPPQTGDQPRLTPAPATPDRKSQTSMPHSEPQPATIHVSIGRIEVKASAPAALPKRGAPVSATMSLDEYLRRRQGGNQ